MIAVRKQLMSVDDFIAWAERQPERWSFWMAFPLAMSPERVVHGDVKYRGLGPLDKPIARAKVPCRFVLDSAAVRIDQRSLYQPDALVYAASRVRRCARDPQPDRGPSRCFRPANARDDLRDKLRGYFSRTEHPSTI